MIKGIKVKNMKVWSDDRGYLTEIVRESDKLLSNFGQAYVSMTLPGVIKAFHWHKKQDDLWYMISGLAQVVLYDQRKNSKTYKQTDVYFMGDNNRIALLIPKGVVHGYRVLGNQPLMLINFVTQEYNAAKPDEERLSFDDPAINFDWTTKNRQKNN